MNLPFLTLVLLGAHSVGNCHKAHQGYEGPWDFTPTKLDNAYYKSLYFTTWVPVAAPTPAHK